MTWKIKEIKRRCNDPASSSVRQRPGFCKVLAVETLNCVKNIEKDKPVEQTVSVRHSDNADVERVR